MNTVRKSNRRFILDDPDSYIEVPFRKFVNSRNIDADTSLSIRIITECLNELYQNEKTETSLNNKIISLYHQEQNNKKKKKLSLDKRIMKLYISELSQDEDLVLNLNNRIIDLFQEIYYENSTYEYKWKEYSNRSFFDVWDDYIFRKKNGIKGQKIYNYNYDEDLYNLLNRSVFNTYKDYLKKISKLLINFLINFGKKTVRTN